jgi:hypothetical protein
MAGTWDPAIGDCLAPDTTVLDKAALEPPCSRERALLAAARPSPTGGAPGFKRLYRGPARLTLDGGPNLLGPPRESDRKEEHPMLVPTRPTQAVETPSRVQLAIREWQRPQTATAES